MTADLIESWNHAAATGANLLLDRALASGTVLVVVAVASVVLRRRASAHLLSWLWLLPLVPLALPLDRLMPTLPSPGIPVRALVARIAPQDRAADSPVLAHDGHLGRELSSAGARPRETARLAPSSPADRPAAGSPDGAGPPERPSALAWVMLAWASVAAALLLRLAICQRRTSRDLAANPPLHDHEACRMLPRLRHVAGVSVPVALVVSETLASPATWGWRRPVIILPRYLLDRLDATQLRWVLLHELAHVRRGDLAVAWIQRLVTIIWWFNPLVWLTNALAEGQRECACDDAASARCEARSRRSCANALFEIVAGSSRPRDATPALATLVDHRSLVRKRLMRLLDAKRPVPAGLDSALGTRAAGLRRALPHRRPLSGAGRSSPGPHCSEEQGRSGDRPRSDLAPRRPGSRRKVARQPGCRAHLQRDRNRDQHHGTGGPGTDGRRDAGR